MSTIVQLFIVINNKVNVWKKPHLTSMFQINTVYFDKTFPDVAYVKKYFS